MCDKSGFLTSVKSKNCFVFYTSHVNEVRNGYYNPIKEYIFNRPPDCKIRLLSTYCSYFVKGLNPGVIS